MAIHTCEGMHHRFVVGPGEPVVCPHCELVTLRAQVKDKDCAVAMLAAQTRAKLELLGKVMELEAQLADCRAVLREMGHEQSCRAHERCKICDKPPWANDHRADIPSHHAHVFSPWGCDCPRGKALAMLEVE